MERQRVLREGIHRFNYLIGEQALHTTVGDHSVMVEQIEHLTNLMMLPRVAFGIVPQAAGFIYTTTNFVIYDQRMVQVETITAELTITQPRELVFYEKSFSALAKQAVHGDAARALMRGALDKRLGIEAGADGSTAV
ncbi:Scr1 family TA system antitoxin-like transcriptional regulator [Nocardia sp. NPDC057440]|uniref:Scr1 family TA system antitoxin-like transcriptional regulator n=1 Tax=Nocardia sp. NPDC057440 TaxID=3346134 RepID=UPI00366BEDB3